jgi:hypothetical protein
VNCGRFQDEGYQEIGIFNEMFGWGKRLGTGETIRIRPGIDMRIK